MTDSMSSDIITPSDLADSYFAYTWAVGAKIHSGGWVGRVGGQAGRRVGWQASSGAASCSC